jgi:hypothetical protein
MPASAPEEREVLEGLDEFPVALESCEVVVGVVVEVVVAAVVDEVVDVALAVLLNATGDAREKVPREQQSPEARASES